jgi:tape measure domain-containing protein
MAANNSALQIEVVSTGIADTVRKLDLLGNAAGRNEAKVKLLTDSLGKLMVAQTTAVSSATAHAASINLIAQAMGMMANYATTTASQVSLLNSQLGTLNATSNNTTNAFTRKSNAGGIVNATIRAMTTAALAYLSINFAKGIVEAADGWKMMQARLKLATGSMEEAKNVQAMLYDMAQRLRVPLEDAAKLYTRMAVPMQRMGQDAQQTANQVEFVSLALKLNGATAAEASSVMLQYSQSVNAGRLNGAEFNAVAEGAPGILRAIEAELKSTGKWSEYGGKTLKQMGSDGEITFELMNRAAQRALPEMRKAFEELPLTVDGAIQRIKNAWFKAMGELGENTDIGSKLAKAIGQLEASIPAIRDALASIFIFLHDNFSMITTVIQVIVAGKFISWLASAALAIPALVTGLMATTAAATGTAGAMGALRIGLTALTGPWGILISLVGTAAVAAWQFFSKEAPKADAVVTSSMRVQTVDRLRLIQQEIDKINERNGVMAVKPPAQYEVTANDREQVALITRINGLKSAQQSMTSKAAKDGAQVTLDMLDTKLKTMQGEQTVLIALKKVNEDAMNKQKGDAVRAGLARKTETKPQEAQRKIDEYNAALAPLGQALTEKEKMAVRIDVLGEKLGAKAPGRDHFKELRTSIAATTAELELNIKAGDKLSASEKLRESLKSGSNVDFRGLSDGQKATVQAEVDKNAALERQIELRDRANKATADASAENERFDKRVMSGTAVINDEILKTQLQTAALTQSKTAVKELLAAEIEADAQAAEAAGNRELEKNYNVARYEAYMAQARALRELAEAKVELGKGQDEKAAMEALDKLLDPKKAFNFGEALGEAFGKAGESIGMMSKALGEYSKDQDKIAAQRQSFMSLTDAKKRSAGMEALDKKEAQSSLRMYGAMASGAKGFFAQHTTAYKVLSGAEKAFRAVELAGTLSNFAEKSGLLSAFTGLFTTAKVTETAIDTTQQGVMLGVHAAAAATDVALTGTTEAAKNTLKIPGVLMSFMSWLGPWGMAAGGAAIAAVLGGALVGGGGGGGAGFNLQERQDRQGTGTVLGDDSEKSASIANAMSSLEDNSNVGLVLTTNMLSALRGIEASMQGLASAIFKVSGMTTGKNFGISEGISGGGFGSSVFGGKKTTSITDTGLNINGTAADFSKGSGVKQYVDVMTQKSGGWFKKDKTSNQRQYMAASEEITTTIGRVFDSINSTVSDAAVSLGANGDSIKAAMASYVISTEVSFKGLVGNELSEALNAVFSASADGIARTVFPGLEAFQAAGEGYYQTLVRVATGTEQAQNALKSFGIEMVGRDSLVNKTGDIAAELVRQSIMAKEAGTTMADVMKVMDGSMTDLVAGYKSLLAIQDTMRGLDLGLNISRDTIRGAGGIAELESAISEFSENFFTDAERQTASFSKLGAEFGRLGVVMPATKDAFRSLVTSLMSGNAESQELAGRVMLLGGAFSDAFQATEDLRSDAIDSLSAAYDKEAEALENIIDKMKGFSESLLAFKGSLLTGDLSTKSTAEKYATAKTTYDDVSTRALAGDESAIAGFEKAASEMLKLSQGINASGAGYTADYERVLAETETLYKFTTTQVDVATESLDTLKEQVKGLLDINESVLTVTEAIFALQYAMMGVDPLAGGDGSQAISLANATFDGDMARLLWGDRSATPSENREYSFSGNTPANSSSALTEEVIALRNELRMLREEQREQTANLVVAQFQSQELNAQTVVEGQRGAMEGAAYLERTRTGFA